MSNTQNSNNLENKVVLITGASSGIGEATALLLAQQGAKLVLGARRTDRLKQLVTDIRNAGGTAEFHTLDVANAASFNAFVDFAVSKFGRVDVLFNNAGVMPLSTMSALKIDEWNNMIDVNIRGVLNGIAAVLPKMEAQGDGQILNNASVAAHWVGPTSAVYSATKHAVWAISEGLRQESQNVRVTVISPGVVATELGHDITEPSSQEMLKVFRQKSITPDAIARAVSYAIAQPKDVNVAEVIVRPTGGF
jgi:NADP-dependent 3-hydroxy acid dehydrogenase YdfG